MLVHSIAVYLSKSGDRRGRICQRSDGLFQYAFEHMIRETDEYDGYWCPIGETSGLYGNQEAAIAALLVKLPGAEEIEGTQQVSMDLNFGYWPDP